MDQRFRGFIAFYRIKKSMGVLQFKKRFSIIILFLFLLAKSTGIAQTPCNAEELGNNCISRLTPDFNFIRKYKLESEVTKDKLEYSYMFVSKTQYIVTICDPDINASGITVNIFDSQRNLVASSKNNTQTISAIAYTCSAAGIYYIQYNFEKASSICGGSALGFKRLL
jgi:hypothetical protein